MPPTVCPALVPLDEETGTLIDRIAAHRSPGRPLPHPRTGRPTEFLLTHHGKRVTVYKLREVMTRVAQDAGLPHTTPHQLRHTYATALEVSGVASAASFGKIRERPLLATSPLNWIRVGWWRPRHTHPDQAIDATVALNATMLQPIRWHPALDSCIRYN